MSPNEKQARRQILDALSTYRDEWMVEMPTEEVTSGQYATLSRQQIDNGVIAMRIALNLTGASIGNVDLYELVRIYLWDEESRGRINEIVKRSRYVRASTGADMQ